ncbi:MAG: hypothetical protein JSV03_05960 [Planctomycetota bacterium]|nr:MAG: hypothetical protein JSV03_05960 [Planctomycetota bacterium]
MRKPVVIPIFVTVLLLGYSAGLAVEKVSGASLPEPNVEMASCWWPEFENVWTPIGWKDHYLQFNVLYNGTVIAVTKRGLYKELGVQLTFIPSVDGVIPEPKPKERRYYLIKKDGGVGNQGWSDCAAPVLWSQWQQDGLILRKEIFAHIAGAGPVQQEMEPQYAWIRLSIHKIRAGSSHDRCYWLVKINKPHIGLSMVRQGNIYVVTDKSVYPGKLIAESIKKAYQSGLQVIEEDNKVLLGTVPVSGCSVRFVDQRPKGRDVYLQVELPAEQGAHIDLLVPRLPVERPVFEAELNLGYDKALEEANRYWQQIPDTAARIETPEPYVNEAIEHTLRFLEVIGLRYPETGQYAQYTGSWHYEHLYSSPNSMHMTMILDPLGYHSVAEKYMEIYREEQGNEMPPGDLYKAHPGHFAPPAFIAPIPWLSNHGAILHAASNHALVTDDKEFIDRWTDPIIKACEFIRDYLAMTDHGGVKGILPPAVATDRKLQIQAVWNDGWHYKGLSTAVRFLQRIEHPRAVEFAKIARDYKQVFVKAILEATPNMPQWADDTGQKHHFTPTALPDGGDTSYPFYLDTGPLFLVYAGLLDADDPLMKLTLKYFREGPNVKKYDLNGSWRQPISLRHEISSCEPCYSWNVFHPHQTGDRYKYLEGMYSLFVGTLSRQTYIGCEHRGGISGTPCSAPLPIHLARLAVIDDQLNHEQLHLLRMVPLAWVTADKPTVFERIATEFGPVSVRFQLQDEGKSLKVTFEPKFRHQPQQVLFHVPPLTSLREVVVNGQVFKVKSNDVLNIR